MQIIAIKDQSYMRRRPPSLALCEVIRQTDKRYYVTLVRGDIWAIDGRGDNKYVSADAVLSFDGAQFDTMVAATQAYAARVRELDALEQMAWDTMEAVLKPVKQEQALTAAERGTEGV